MRRLLAVLIMATGLSALEWVDGSVRKVAADLGASEIRARYPFRNDSGGELHILEVKTDCSCTVSSLERLVYGPGEAGAIDIEFRLGARVGNSQRKVSVAYRVGDGPRLVEELVLSVDIPRVIQSDRTTIAFHSKGKDVAWENQEIRLSPGADPNVRIRGLDLSEVKHFEVVLLNANHEPFDPEKDRLPGFLRVRPTSAEPRVIESLFVLTDHPMPRYERVRFHLFMRVEE